MIAFCMCLENLSEVDLEDSGQRECQDSRVLPVLRKQLSLLELLLLKRNFSKGVCGQNPIPW